MKLSRSSLAMAAGAFAYLVAVTNRSSLGIATLEATDRFHVSAAELSTLAVAQLMVYALMQVPVGILLDRLGPRTLIAFGAIAMSVGQYLVAFSTELTGAVFGRMLLGLGDAFIFISMIRLVNGWYKGVRATRLQQLLTNIGQLGQAVSAIPFSFLLHQVGWTPAFGFLATLTLTLFVVSLVLIRDDREKHLSKQKPPRLRAVVKLLRKNAKHPAVRMAFWTHFTLQSATSVFILLWGFPFLVDGQGIDRQLASLIIASFVLTGFAVGPVVSNICAKSPHLRDRLVISGSLAIAAVWALIIFGPEKAPIFSIVALVLVLSAAGPMSMIAFDYTRAFVPVRALGSTNGLVNIGGFFATFSVMYLAGVVLDMVQSNQQAVGLPAVLYSATGFRWAMSLQFVVVAVGLTMFLWERSKLANSQVAE